MLAIVLLVIGLLCVLIGRILLIGAAFGVSAGWGIGVLLPFGPLFFRLSHPELAPASLKFRLAGIACIFAYFVTQPGLPSISHRSQTPKQTQVPSAPSEHYALEKAKATQTSATPSLDERRAVNAQEFERLSAWSRALKLKKRDLLHSDVQGNRAYDAELVEYNAALAKATEEKKNLDK